jgi:hypothetical protein
LEGFRAEVARTLQAASLMPDGSPGLLLLGEERVLELLQEAPAALTRAILFAC